MSNSLAPALAKRIQIARLYEAIQMDQIDESLRALVLKSHPELMLGNFEGTAILLIDLNADLRATLLDRGGRVRYVVHLFFGAGNDELQAETLADQLSGLTWMRAYEDEVAIAVDGTMLRQVDLPSHSSFPKSSDRVKSGTLSMFLDRMALQNASDKRYAKYSLSQGNLLMPSNGLYESDLLWPLLTGQGVPEVIEFDASDDEQWVLRSPSVILSTVQEFVMGRICLPTTKRFHYPELVGLYADQLTGGLISRLREASVAYIQWGGSA